MIYHAILLECEMRGKFANTDREIRSEEEISNLLLGQASSDERSCIMEEYQTLS